MLENPSSKYNTIERLIKNAKFFFVTLRSFLFEFVIFIRARQYQGYQW